MNDAQTWSTNTRPLRICSWNVNGIKNPFGYKPWSDNRSFQFMFDLLEADIVCFQEAKLQRRDMTLDMVELPGWDSFYCLPASKKGYSGVVVYTRRSRCVPIKAEEGITGILPDRAHNNQPYRELPAELAIGGYPEGPSTEALLTDKEGRGLVIDFGLFVLINVYCPALTDESRQEYRMAFLESLERRVRSLHNNGREIVVLGDLNIIRNVIDTADLKRNSKEPKGEEFITESPSRSLLNRLLIPHEEGILIDLCRHFHPNRTGMYTHWETKINARPGNYGTRIDYILCTEGLLRWFVSSDTLPGLMGSDHCPIWADMHLSLSASNSYLLDEVNAPGVFINGEAQHSPSAPPKLAARNLPEFVGRQSIQSMFQRSASFSKSKHYSTPPRADSSSSRSDSTDASKLSQAKSHKVKKHVVSSKANHSKGTLMSFLRKEPVQSPTEDILLSETGQPRTAQVHTTDEEERRETQAIWQSLFTKKQAPRCQMHNEPCIEMVTKKSGPNAGRHFWICSRPVGPGYENSSRPKSEVNTEWRCKYFQWTK